MSEKKRILIVEDEEIIASMLKDNFEQMGYEVFIANSGMEGLSRSEKIHPDVITLDLMMPGLDGLEVLKRLKKNDSTKDIPVVLISVSSAENKKEALELGAIDFFKKPVDFDRLDRKIKALSVPKKKILVVEDDTNIIKMMEIKLGSLGYEVFSETSAEKAIILAKHDKPDVILVDYYLPRMNGIQMIAELKKDKVFSGVPFMIYSGAISEDIDNNEIIGIEKFLGAPFSVEELAKEVDLIFKNQNK